MSQIIVLGWDALDVELINDHGLTGRFGKHQTKIETRVNPITDETHTKELWPSLITGMHPDQHGVHAVTDEDGIEWKNPWLNLASDLANGVVPEPILAYLGERLREQGAALPMKQTEYYTNIETVFDGFDSRPISIPNYQTELDCEQNLDANRDQVWADLLVDRRAQEGYKPQLSTEGVYNILGGELGKRVGQTLTAINQGHDLVWTWFGAIDTAGHMAPAIEQPIERDWYTVAANITETVHDVAPDDAVILSLSDHGLQDGKHTQYATLCSDSQDAVDAIDTIYDVQPWIKGQNPSAERSVGGIDQESMVDVEQQLEDLGYV